MVKTNNSSELKEILIKNGLILLNKDGFQDFSIRKVAAMSGVSHGAPYKHFKNKEELLSAITMSVLKSFKESLQNTVRDFSNDPRICLAELGKRYVQFMVENPEHMKFLFLTARKNVVTIRNNAFVYDENSPFAIFKDAAAEYLKTINADPADHVTDVLSILSVVHGISILIVENSISFEDDYLSIVSKMIYNRLKS